jgi:hypothetical protein
VSKLNWEQAARRGKVKKRGGTRAKPNPKPKPASRGETVSKGWREAGEVYGQVAACSHCAPRGYRHAPGCRNGPTP